MLSVPRDAESRPFPGEGMPSEQKTGTPLRVFHCAPKAWDSGSRLGLPSIPDIRCTKCRPPAGALEGRGGEGRKETPGVVRPFQHSQDQRRWRLLILKRPSTGVISFIYILVAWTRIAPIPAVRPCDRNPTPPPTPPQLRSRSPIVSTLFASQ